MPTMRKVKQKQEPVMPQEKETFFALDITDVSSGEFSVGPCSTIEELHKDIERTIVDEDIEEPLKFVILKQVAIVNVSVETKLKIENIN